MKSSSKLVAVALAGMVMAIGASAQDKTKEAKVKCAGINACKGKSSCAIGKNGCAGKNSCKGTGWVATTAKECKDKKGTDINAMDMKKY